jgi:site-specific DNA recombinase
MYQNINKIYHAAIYVRLSKEDGDISSSAKLESNSISNQKALILDFLKDKKEYVDEDVLRLIQSHMKAVLDTEKLIREMNSASRNQTQYLLLDKEVGKLRRELSRISKRKSDLYEDYSERLITEEEYMQFSRIYSNEIENIKNRLDVVLAAQVRYSKDYHIEEGWGKVIHTYMSKRKLTKEMADAFVDSIIIHGKYDYEIKLVYDDQFADLQKLKKEKEAQSR